MYNKYKWYRFALLEKLPVRKFVFLGLGYNSNNNIWVLNKGINIGISLLSKATACIRVSFCNSTISL